jgi:DNA polymerase I
MDDAAVKNRLILIDGSSLAYRAYFALPEGIATRDGFPTNAIYGLSQMLLKLVTEFEPAAVAVAWDAREKTFRHEEFDGYKAQRPSMPEPLSRQWAHLPDLMDAFGIPNLVKPGFEADDILGTLAEEAKRQGRGSLVVTGDRDALQIVDDDIWVVTTGRGVTDVKVYTPAGVVERFGVTPAQIPDYIGLKGDTSDNIPGVPGVGEKTAAALVQQFGTVESLYERLDEVSSEKRRALLVEHEAAARLSKRLACMVLDVPLDEDIVDIVSRTGYTLPRREVEEFFKRFEFATLVRRVRDMARPDDGDAGPRGDTATAAVGKTDFPRVIVASDAQALISAVARGPAAVGVVPSGDQAGDGLVAAVFDGGDQAVAGLLSADDWRRLWGSAAHVVAHDAKALPSFAAATSDPAFDTAIAAYLIAPERFEGDLFKLARVDEEQVAEGPHLEALAATRAVLTWRLCVEQRTRLAELGLEALFAEIELPLVRVLAAMESAGVAIDVHRLGEITARLRDRVDEVRDLIFELAGGEFTIGSTQQVAEVLFTRLGLQPVRKGKTGFSTDARVLKTLREQHAIVPLIEEWRELTKLVNTYLEPLPAHIDPRTGRLHTTFNQTVASTGRLSSSNPNLQNIPIRTELGSQIRDCFVAADGMRLVVADYSQIELRLMAFLAQEPALIDAYRRGEDVHRVTAAAVAGIPVGEVTKTQRERAKATNFGIMYGLSAFGLSEQVDMPVDEARAFIDAYFEKYPRVKVFREKVIAEALEAGFVTTVFGRRRAVPELRAHSFRERALGERLAVNSVLQGSAADIIKVAMLRVTAALAASGRRSRLVLQIHDELVFESPDDEIDELLPLVRECMCGAFTMDPPLDISIGVGDTWLSAK